MNPIIQPWTTAIQQVVGKFFGSYEDHQLQGAALRGARTKEGLTQKQLSQLANIPQGHISEIENGKRQVGVLTVKKLGKALNISYKVFL